MGYVVLHPMQRVAAGRILLLIIASSMIGCQAAPVVSVRKLEQHRELADLSGLKPAQIVEALRVSWAVPSGNWQALPVKTTPLYTHQQWKSPSASTGVGVAHIKMPLALPAQMVIWFAKNEYIRRAQNQDGKLIAQWTDDLGRQWFEAEDAKYHVKGYAMVKGTEAWIIYSGYRLSLDRKPNEIAIAERSLDSVVPVQ
jgi:hypothetical protein